MEPPYRYHPDIISLRLTLLASESLSLHIFAAK